MVAAGSPGKHSNARTRFPPVTQRGVISGCLASPSVGEADSKTAVFVWIAHEQAPAVMAGVESAADRVHPVQEHRMQVRIEFQSDDARCTATTAPLCTRSRVLVRRRR